MLAPSAFAHRYDLPDGSCAVYHALSLDCVYVGPEVRELFRPVWDRPVPFPIPDGGIGDVKQPYPVPEHQVLPHDWVAAGADDAARAKRQEVVDLFASMHILQEDGDTFDATWVGQLQGLAQHSPMKMLTIVPTTLCNFRCTYCHESEESRSARDKMSIAQVDAIIGAWKKYARRAEGKKDVLLYGGEPMLAPKIVRHVIEHFSEAGPDEYGGEVCIILVTNASRMTPEWARFFKKHDTFLIVSCDAMEDENDTGRVTQGGRGTFPLIEKGYRMLQKEGVRTAISVTVGTHNARNIHKSFPDVIDHFKPLDIGLNSCLHQPYGQAENDIACTALEGTERMLEAYAAARARGVYVEQFNRRVRPFAIRAHRVKDCSACGGRLVAQPNGKFSFCDGFSFTDEYTYDFDGDFDLETNGDYARWSELSPLNWPDCYECPAVALCGGGCRYDAAMASGRIDGLDPFRCTQDREILRWTINDLSGMLSASALTGCDVIIPSEAARKALLGELTLDALTIPLGNANRYGERVGRPQALHETSRD